MTTAPSNLLDVRKLLLTHLNIDESSYRHNDLESNEVGIVGDPTHRGGYHCGSDRVITRDYSVIESTRDSRGLTLDASALDVGWFQVSVGGITHNLYSFNRWVVSQCISGEPDTHDIREVIYTPDGKSVRRYDRLGRRSGGDDSHLFHTHLSFFRDAIKARRNQTALFARYLTHIGLIEKDLSMTYSEQQMRAFPWQYSGNGMPNVPQGKSTLWVLGMIYTMTEAIAAKVDISPEELTAIKEAATTGAFTGAISASDTLAEAIISKLPDTSGGWLSREQVVSAVEEGVRDAFSHGLAEGVQQ